jgi:four helix bundle protein
MSLESFKDLIAWQVSMELAREVYSWTRRMPKEHRYEIASQMNRSAISIPANIAEGYGRRNRGEYLQFLGIARGSATELETLCILAVQLELGSGEVVLELIQRSQQLLWKLEKSLE